MWLPKIVQVEVTTACQLKCIFCPHTILKKQWVNAHLDWEVFSALLPFVRKIDLVHLQGWGEPLLHPRFWDMAAAVKQKGGRVSVTTNGMLMDEAASRQFCQLGFSLVAISIAGARPQTNDSLRVGASLDQVCANISYLCHLRHRPKVHLVMQMMSPNIDELSEVVALAAKLGADKVIFPNLDYTPTPEVAALRAYTLSPDPRHAELVKKAQGKGKELGIKVDVYPLTPDNNVAVCDANPLHNIWVTVWGEVAPCAYLALPCRGDFPRLFWGMEEQVSRFSFGKLSDGLDKVLQGQAARSFREAFIRRLPLYRTDIGAEVQLLAAPRSVPFSELQSRRGDMALPPPPPPCLHCYKLYGI